VDLPDRTARAVGNDAVCDAAPTVGGSGRLPSVPARAVSPHRLAEFDVVLMRKDPPVDIAYLHATLEFLESRARQTVLVKRSARLRELKEPSRC